MQVEGTVLTVVAFWNANKLGVDSFDGSWNDLLDGSEHMRIVLRRLLGTVEGVCTRTDVVVFKLIRQTAVPVAAFHAQLQSGGVRGYVALFNFLVVSRETFFCTPVTNVLELLTQLVAKAPRVARGWRLEYAFALRALLGKWSVTHGWRPLGRDPHVSKSTTAHPDVTVSPELVTWSTWNVSHISKRWFCAQLDRAGISTVSFFHLLEVTQWISRCRSIEMIDLSWWRSAPARPARAHDYDDRMRLNVSSIVVAMRCWQSIGCCCLFLNETLYVAQVFMQQTNRGRQGRSHGGIWLKASPFLFRWTVRNLGCCMVNVVLFQVSTRTCCTGHRPGWCL